MTVTAFGGGMQPWNKIQFPTSGEVPFWGTTSMIAKAIPSFSRVLQLIAGMAKQMPLDDYQGDTVKPRPRLLDQPDPDVGRPWWVDMQIQDYLVHGNALHLVTSRDVAGFPLTVSWVPAEWVSITWREDRRGVQYWVSGRELDPADVVHVRRGADPWCPYRGVGLLEQHLAQLTRISDQERYESGVMRGSAVPSVAVIAPNASLSQEEADVAKSNWVEKYGGPVREPAILPAGTQVIPLAWSPADTQMVELRKMGLTDMANMANMDGYWVGAPAGSFTYRTPGPMYLNLIRQTVNPILEDFEGEWSHVWVPRGHRVKFDRIPVLKDDMTSMVNMLSTAVSNKLVTKSEARTYLGYSGEVPEELLAKPVPPELLDQADDTNTDDSDEDDQTEEAS